MNKPTNARDRTFDTLAESFAPRRSLTVWEWAEQNVILPAGTTPRPGPYSTDWCPYVREPMEAYTDPAVRTIVLCFATRSAKTEIFLNCLRYSVAEERQPCLWAKPNREDAQNDSEGRFRPSVESSPILRSLKPANPHHYRISTMRFRRSPVYFVGAGSSAQLRNKQIGRLFCDEIDTWKRASDRETGALENSLERVKDTPNPKILMSSTPTVASAQVWKEFIKGDQRYYWMPCYFCEKPLRFNLKGLRWSEDAKHADGTWDLAIVKESVHYLCPHCNGQILDKHKLPMLKAGRWLPMPTPERLRWEGKVIPPEDGRRSYHLNSLYPEWLHFYTFAEKFLFSKPDPEAWQSFINQWLAEPYFNFGDRDEMLEALQKTSIEPALDAPRVPDGYRPLMHVDLQQLECWFRIRAFNARRESVGIEFGMAATLEDCEIIRKKSGIPFAGIDIGYHDRLQEALEFIHRHNPHWLATHGSGTMYVPIRLAEIHIGGGVLKGVPVPCIKTNPVVWKEILTKRIKGDPPAWKNEPDINELYAKQMAGEARRERRGLRGTVTVEYVKVGQNHAWDNEYNLLAMFDVLRPVMFGIQDTGDDSPPDLPPGPGPTRPAGDGESSYGKDRDEREGGVPDQVWQDERALT